MPFSKFDPRRPPGDGPDGDAGSRDEAGLDEPDGAEESDRGGLLGDLSDAPKRRVAFLELLNPLVFAYTAFGFCLIFFWLARGWTSHPFDYTLAAGATGFGGYLVGRLWSYRSESPLLHVSWYLALLLILVGLGALGYWMSIDW